MEKQKKINKTLLLQTAQFAPEMIKDFCVKKADWIQEYSDLDVREGYEEAGFMIDGRIRGFMWRRDWDNGPGSVDYYYCGLADDQLHKYNLLCWVRYQPERPYSGFMVSNYMPSGLLERDEKERIIFCGVHKNGVRHGLGSEFSYDNEGKISELQGLWENGTFTHKRSGDTLIPVE